MSGGAKHAVVVIAIMLSFANARCFATCSPDVVAAASRSESTEPINGDCHKHSSSEREGHQQKDRNSHEGKTHSCLHDAVVTASDTYNTSSLLSNPVPAIFAVSAFSALLDHFVPAGRFIISDLSPPVRLHPNLTIVIRV